MSFQKFWAKVTKLLKETIQFSQKKKTKMNPKTSGKLSWKNDNKLC